jgi:hypothetical protein
MDTDKDDWATQFQIQSKYDLDFVIGQNLGLPIGLQRGSPPEFRRRILAGAISFQLQLRSIDYGQKRYVEPRLYEQEDVSLGNATSDYLRDSVNFLEEELKKLHTADPTFGVFGSEITLFRIPYSIDVARMLANRGLLLEVLPVLRLCLEMMCWAAVAFHMKEEEQVVALRAQSCISRMKEGYPTVGKLYGYLSQYSHWGHMIHGQFLHVDDEQDQIGVLKASVRYRAMALALCLVVLDVLVEAVREIYGERSTALVLRVQGSSVDTVRNTYQNLSKIVELSGLEELKEIQSLML